MSDQKEFIGKALDIFFGILDRVATAYEKNVQNEVVRTQLMAETAKHMIEDLRSFRDSFQGPKN